MANAAELIAALRTFRRKEETLAGIPITIRSLSGAERDLLRSRASAGNPLTPSELVCFAVCDASFAPVFTAEQLVDLSAGDGQEIDRLAVEILELSGLGQTASEVSAKN